MDPDINIMKRQIAEETAEKYYLMTRVKELTEELDTLKAKLNRMENPATIRGDEKSWKKKENFQKKS